LIFGSLDIPVAEVQNDGIAKYMRDNLQHGLLAKGFEDSYAESKIAGAILMGSTDCMSDVPMDKLEMAFGVFNRMIGDGTVHRGIYVNDGVSLRVYSMIGNLPLPESRMKNLRRGK